MTIENNLKLQSDQNALMIRADRLQGRANLILASAAVVQEYVQLVHQLTQHISDLNSHVLRPSPLHQSVPKIPPGETSATNSHSASSFGNASDKTISNT